MEPRSSAHREVALWPDDNSWIDLAAVRESLFACVDPSTGVVDAYALTRVEFEHNRRAVADALDAVPIGGHIGVVKSCWSHPRQRDYVDGGTIYIARRKQQQFALARPDSPTWTLQDTIDAIAAVSLDVHIDARGRGDFSGWFRKLGHIAERSWMRAATAALADGPGQDSWTAYTIDTMGTVLRALVSLCDDRAHRRHHVPVEGLCSPRAVKLAATLASSFDGGALGAAYDKDWARVVDMERSLRGMLAWIDAMERTDAIFEHMLKHHQAERIDRAIAADPHFVSPPDETARPPPQHENK
ncbi:hypothetical protein pkur_cds_196 [Pandoravirus kuranda]|uniref:Uncharacterized protein n=2 Tax=Pandoravirus TaxID=2060084 RepID=A0AA95J7G3_9VIRU|nr:hypothetical protein pneo_cds_218 [Pandoravirus neocaledonia]AVK75825.1 hypothetical protein pneo_cds_218 [Pandoravirus neocaledonia]WBR14371.1 hypothetical protein pkur_cds_196 [Pandoravirus kuranda]